MNFNGFTWLLLAFPVYLLARGRFVDYIKLTGSGQVAGEDVQHGATGGW